MVQEDKPVVTKLADASEKAGNIFSQWWHLTTADKRPKSDPKNLVSVSELPIYGEDGPQRSYRFVEEEPLPLQREFTTVRRAFNTEYERVTSKFAIVDTAVTKTTNAVTKANAYIHEEWTVLPKAAAITVGGMAGFVLGLRRGAIGRTLTTASGLVTMAAFCYPHETVDVVRTGVAHTEQAWDEFQNPPNLDKKKKIDLSPPK